MADDDSGRQQRTTRWPIKAAAVVLLLAAIVSLVAVNGQMIPVRPFGQMRLNQVLAAPLLIGLIVGWIIRGRVAAWSTRRAARRAENTQAS